MTDRRRTPLDSRGARIVGLSTVALCGLEAYRIQWHDHPWRVVLLLALAAIALSTLPWVLQPREKEFPLLARMLLPMVVATLDEMGRADAVNPLDWVVPAAMVCLGACTLLAVRRGERAEGAWNGLWTAVRSNGSAFVRIPSVPESLELPCR